MVLLLWVVESMSRALVLLLGLLCGSGLVLLSHTLAGPVLQALSGLVVLWALWVLSLALAGSVSPIGVPLSSPAILGVDYETGWELGVGRIGWNQANYYEPSWRIFTFARL